jgi:hypothetical protein
MAPKLVLRSFNQCNFSFSQSIRPARQFVTVVPLADWENPVAGKLACRSERAVCTPLLGAAD